MSFVIWLDHDGHWHVEPNYRGRCFECREAFLVSRPKNKDRVFHQTGGNSEHKNFSHESGFLVIENAMIWNTDKSSCFVRGE